MKIYFIKRLAAAVITGTLVLTAGIVTPDVTYAYAKNASKAKKTAVLTQPDNVDATSVSFKDKFISKTQNRLTISWKKAANANQYEIKSHITGTTDDQSVITKIDNADTQTVYSGKNNKASVTIPRNTMFHFEIRSIAGNKKNKTYSDWTGFNYYPATYDTALAIKIVNYTVRYWGKDAKDKVNTHGNVISLIDDIKIDNIDIEHNNEDRARVFGKVKSIPTEDRNTPIIIDFAGHTIDCTALTPVKPYDERFALDFGVFSYIFQDSVGGGGLRDHIDKPLNPNYKESLSVRVSSLIINGGTYSIDHDYAIWLHAYDPLIINGGNFDNNINASGSARSRTMIINGGNFRYIYLQDDTALTINDGSFQNGLTLASKNNSCVINGGTFHASKEKPYELDLYENPAIHVNSATIKESDNVSHEYNSFDGLESSGFLNVIRY